MSGSPPDPSAPAGRSTDRDAGLLARLRSDDRDALAALYDAYGRLSFGLAYRIVGDPGDAEDVVQEAFLTLWRQAGRIDPRRGTVRSLLLTIVHRRAIDVLRRRAGRPRAVPDDALQLLPATVGDPVEFATLTEERDRVRRALAALPPDQRQAVELTYFGGLTVAELAERAAVPVGTAKSRLRLALERMRKALPDEG